MESAKPDLDESLRVMRLPEVIARTGMGRDAIYAMVRADEFPAPRRLSKRAVGWNSNEVTAWIKALPPAESSQPAAIAAKHARRAKAHGR